MVANRSLVGKMEHFARPQGLCWGTIMPDLPVSWVRKDLACSEVASLVPVT